VVEVPIQAPPTPKSLKIKAFGGEEVTCSEIENILRICFSFGVLSPATAQYPIITNKMNN